MGGEGVNKLVLRHDGVTGGDWMRSNHSVFLSFLFFSLSVLFRWFLGVQRRTEDERVTEVRGEN